MGKLVLNRDASFLLNPPFPHNMLIELTNACNHRCVFCGYQKMRRDIQTCDEELSKKLIHEAYENGTREIGFYIIGEPLLYAGLPGMIAYAKRLGYEYIYITTNGVLASKPKMEELVEAGLDSIKFSVNAASPEIYKKIHGKDDFGKVRKNIEDLHYMKQEKNLAIKIFLSFIKNEWNKNEESLLFEHFGKLVDEVYVFDCINQGGEMDELVEMGIIDKENIKPGSTLPCDMVFNRIHITVEGYLSACCADFDGYLAAVDLHQMSLKDAWESTAMQDLRKRHLENDLKGTVCYNCIFNKKDAVYPINKELCHL